MTRAPLGKTAGTFLLFAALSALWLDTGASLWSGWRPFGRVECIATISLLTATLALLGLCGYLPARHWLWRHAAETAILLVVSAIGIVVLEYAASRILPGVSTSPPFHTRGANVRQTFHPAPDTMPGLTGPARYTTDANGIRCATPLPAEGAYRILCVGGSSTECTYLDDAETWPALLMRYLNESAIRNVWVGNVGISGFAMEEHLRFLRESPLLDEAECIVLQAGINDLWRYLAGEETQIRYERFATTVATRTPEAEPHIRRPLWSRSNMIQLYHLFRRARAQDVHVDPVMVEGSGGDEYAIRRARRAEAAKTDTLPDLGPGLNGFRERLWEAVVCCRRRGLDIVLTTQPVLWRGDLTPEVASRCWFGWLPDNAYLTLGALKLAMDAYNAALIETCVALEVPCVDLGKMNGNAEFFYDDCHFTERGAEEVARSIAAVVGSVAGKTGAR